MGGEWRVRVEGKEAESRCGLRWTRVALAVSGGAGGAGVGLVRISPQISASPATGFPLRTSVQLPTMGSTSPPWELDKPKLSEERVDLALTWVGHLRAHLLIGFPLERVVLGEGERGGATHFGINWLSILRTSLCSVQPTTHFNAGAYTLWSSSWTNQTHGELFGLDLKFAFACSCTSVLLLSTPLTLPACAKFQQE